MARGPVDLSRRCAHCLFPFEACLCPDVRRVETRTRFLVLRHASEHTRPSNSGRWAALALPGARLVEYALPGAGGLCTLEAMAAALHLLGETEAGRALDGLHAAALERSWRLRRGAAVAAQIA